ncbi:TonB family protein [Sinimarinibacterium sp. CAU 1509]|uniref:energy transducer TonB n=1 Tax=Sinimarinibacterium sp. CAU 1509 TaxID=2562283 RepID=UPI0010AC534F|nr:energy transducer TonB [Sinimarinibacterium sp. CAU 1509]TJY60971.1 TonB family protein [Sinimarinibacterium sp. CAU 1509]
MTRWLVTPPAAVVVALALFLLMYWLIRPPKAPDDLQRLLPEIEVVQPDPPKQDQQQDLSNPDSAPPPPPAAPPSLARPDLPTVQIPTVTTPLNAGPIAVPANLGSSGLNLGSSGAFGGFAGRGSGQGSGGNGTGQGFKGVPLVPLSTARPQMPEWACKKGIRGWVEVVFTVLPEGKVTNVRLIDADPRGVFEAAAIESVSNWIYASGPKAREVKQRVPMDPADCAYNWQ